MPETASEGKRGHNLASMHISDQVDALKSQSVIVQDSVSRGTTIRKSVSGHAGLTYGPARLRKHRTGSS